MHWRAQQKTKADGKMQAQNQKQAEKRLTKVFIFIFYQFFDRCFNQCGISTRQLVVCSSLSAWQILQYYAVLAFKDLFIIILLRITVASDEPLGRNRLLCFKPFTVIL